MDASVMDIVTNAKIILEKGSNIKAGGSVVMKAVSSQKNNLVPFVEGANIINVKIDHLPEMALFCALYRYGMAVRPCLYPNFSFSSACRFRLASRRRHYLHRRRHHLWFETSFIQCPS